jgi:acetyl esterase/lipase
MPNDLTAIHPELRDMWKVFPRMTFNRWNTPVLRWMTRLPTPRKIPAGIRVDQCYTQCQDGQPGVRLRVYRPEQAAAPAPGLLWIHGGGFFIGSPEQDDAFSVALAQEMGIVVVSVDYRLAPKHPFPAPLEDCYAALGWVHGHPLALGIDPDRIAIGGSSAGGGLAATLAQLAHDRGEVRPVFQLLSAPMLDNRTTLRAGLPHEKLLTWNQKSNCYGWSSYLNQPCGAEDVPPYAAAARCEDLAGLPPAWVGVGTLDLFHDEDVAYAQRLRSCGVDCALEIVPGAFHGFDAFRHDLPIVQAFRKSQITALRKYLFHEPS